ncbi:hypothetical protein [Streptosporangium sp. G12]
MAPEHIEQAAEDVWSAYVELTVNGFAHDEAVKLAGLVLMHADRRGNR